MNNLVLIVVCDLTRKEPISLLIFVLICCLYLDQGSVYFQTLPLCDLCHPKQTDPELFLFVFADLVLQI